VPGYEASTWYGVVAPRKTPTDIIDKLNKEINEALADPGISARICGAIEAPLAFAIDMADRCRWLRFARNALPR
jgi:hypothetical protein